MSNAVPTSLTWAEIGGFVLIQRIWTHHIDHKYLIMRYKRRGRESNPRIEVLQTPTLPLGYPAASANGRLGARRRAVNETTFPAGGWMHAESAVIIAE